MLDVAKLVQSQQVLNGANVNSTLIKSSSYRTLGDEVSERMEFQRTTTPPFFSCFDLDVCRTGLDFCNQRRKACEKCEDYQRTCGTNLQELNCTEYCVGLLVKERCMANVATKQTTTPTTTGRFLESREQKNASDCLSKPGDKNDLKFIITIETNIGKQNSCIRRMAEDDVELNSIRAEEQGREVDNDKWSTFGYSSSSTQGLTGNPVINSNINITLNGMQNHTSAMPTETEREASKSENIGKETPYSVQETYDNDISSSSVNFVVNDHAQTKNQKPISDENNCTKIAIGDMSVDMDDVTNCYKQDTSCRSPSKRQSSS